MKSKKCTRCHLIKSVNEFSKTKQYKNGYHIYCKPCRVQMQRQTFLNNPETQRSYKRKWLNNHKELVLRQYSKGEPKCCRCGFTDVRALTIDHINGGGGKHRKEISHICRWLVKNNFPDGFQILCMNCQFIKRVEKKEYIIPISER